MSALFLSLWIASPCSQAAPIDQGELAPCTGIILSVEQVQKTLRTQKELQIRKAFRCPECPACPPCPPKQSVNVWSWAMGGVLAGIFSTVILGVGLASVF